MTPLRTISLGPFPLRIYASPLSVPDHPWASFEDLATLAEMDEVDQDRWLAGLRRDVPDMLHDMPDGTTIIAEPMVGGLFQAWVMMGAERAQALLDEWTTAWTELFVEQNAGLSQVEWKQVKREAGLRNIPNVPGVTAIQ